MRLLFGRGKGKSREPRSPQPTAGCTHPVSHQVPLYQDPVAPTRLTGIKCTNCGAELPPP